MSGETIIVEYVVVGKSVKVTAIDTQTMREVSIVGPRKASKKELESVAVQKLKYMMKKDEQP